MTSLKTFILAFVCVCLGIWSTNGLETISPNNIITIQYDIVNNNRTINFTITAKVRGWVAVGFNARNGSMYGADYFIGGVGAANRTYGGDYYTNLNASMRQPQPDTRNDWTIQGGIETTNSTGNFTRISMSRLLNTGDTQHDVVIPNATINLLWAYNTESDSTTSQHSARGSVSRNLLVRGGGGGTATSNTAGTFFVLLSAFFACLKLRA